MRIKHTIFISLLVSGWLVIRIGLLFKSFGSFFYFFVSGITIFAVLIGLLPLLNKIRN